MKKEIKSTNERPRSLEQIATEIKPTSHYARYVVANSYFSELNFVSLASSPRRQQLSNSRAVRRTVYGIRPYCYGGLTVYSLTRRCVHAGHFKMSICLQTSAPSKTGLDIR
jgi:hypothetical protein